MRSSEMLKAGCFRLQNLVNVGSEDWQCLGDWDDWELQVEEEEGRRRVEVVWTYLRGTGRQATKGNTLTTNMLQ
eukprot:NODE_150_length_1791_cov_352.397819_g103_i0.p8 GENE.NODE_150_length_1791_cov_352.397819_g103_i0~~NODE_150_length_1791_cov_352.397819_g103_i0.p8  ORF type:complete len:74 (+),score=11.20 NODE_150_length_1791_cov_352.397819_g103_i0:1524-1745(+)